MNVAHLLHRSSSLNPRSPALANGGTIVADYARLATRAASLAWTFRNRFRLAAGGRVALFAANCPQYVEVMFGCWYAGLVVVPINAKLHPAELAFILNDCGARLCFVTSEYEVGARSVDAPALLEIIDLRSVAYSGLCTESAAAIESREPDDVAWLFYTSGTTGRPKGVMITHRNLLALTLNYAADLDTINPGDTLLHAAPMSHGSGLYVLPHVAHAALNAAPESGGFDPDEVHELMRAHHGVTIFAAPTMVKRMVDCRAGDDLPNLKTIVYGGGPMYVADCRRALARYGYRLAQIYGQGEAPMTITVMNKALHAVCDHPQYERRLASVGRAFTGVEIRIADSDDRPVSVGETGEILVRGDVVMSGYWRNEEATAETLRGGWLHTGDIGVLDEEGFLTLKDRSKDVIISGGANIYPREVEEILLRHSSVAEVAVVGEQDPDWGECVVAFVVVKPASTVTAHDLDALCLENLARFKRPRRYHLIDVLPKNMTGKVLKTELLRRLGYQPSSPVSERTPINKPVR